MMIRSIRPERDPVKAREAALESLIERMPEMPVCVIALAMEARDAAASLMHGTVGRTSFTAATETRAVASETAYLDAKYGYGIRPWLPLLWAGWKPEQPTE